MACTEARFAIKEEDIDDLGGGGDLRVYSFRLAAFMWRSLATSHSLWRYGWILATATRLWYIATFYNFSNFLANNKTSKSVLTIYKDRLCGLVVRVSGYRSRGPSSIPAHFQIFWEIVVLERSPLSREYNWGATWKKKWRLRSRKSRMWS
jgi:hypothetical protein